MKKYAFIYLMMMCLLGFGTMGYSQEVKIERKEPSFYVDKLNNFSFPSLPKELNGVAVEKLKGYKTLLDLYQKGDKYRIEIIAYTLLYKDVKEKLDRILEFGKDTEDEYPVSKIFSDGFNKTNLDKLMESLPSDLTEEEREYAKSVLEDKIRVLDLSSFEDEIISEEKLSPKRGRIFYDNACQKMKVFIEDTFKKMEKWKDDYRESFQNFAMENVMIEISISNKPETLEVKSEFKEGDPLIINMAYSSEGVYGDIPAKWKLTYPNGVVKGGDVTLLGGKLKEKVEIYQGNIPNKDALGLYHFSMRLFSNSPYEKVFVREFRVGEFPFSIYKVFVLDANKKIRKVFKAGSKIILGFNYIPSKNAPEKALFIWNVFDPSGKKVKSLSTAKTLKVRRNKYRIQTKAIRGIIPKEARDGKYKFQAIIKYKDKKIVSKIETFGVISKLYVDVITSKKKVRIGEKIIFSADIMGGCPPYKIVWTSDTGKTSTYKSIALIFNNTGKRWVELSVVDSAKPKPARAKKRVYVQVLP